MREQGVAVADEESLTDMVWANADRFADAVALRRRVDGSWIDVTTADFADQVLALARGLIAMGLEPGDRVALRSRPSYEWTLLDFAIWTAGCVSVPVADDHAVKAEFVATESGEFTPAIDELVALGAGVDPREVHARRLSVRASDVATVVDGAELTHRDLLTGVRSTIAAFPELLRPGTATLVFLPLTGLVSRVVSLCSVYARTTLGHLPTTETLAADLATFRPTFVVADPAVLTDVYLTARAAQDDRLFTAAEQIAVSFSKAPTLALRVRRAAMSKLVYRGVRAILGGRCEAVILAENGLDEELGHFFGGIGVQVHPSPTFLAATAN
ncbi:Long-chain-fatty-acid--CoA ligase [Alloactinosynnema sp. L-07]|uniref:AMP-binding protein n=1 Tax=Alloactinosynnema sp. L-07 TaxID=1653480 RepID=UPI00065EF8CE|nr:AMP-binding protein [Alloactinosynnema sp. L-07]CRK55705.1 Long-chain-fatty-acid--CoA ligase [Alloactinosynnema sp. L-07]